MRKVNDFIFLESSNLAPCFSTLTVEVKRACESHFRPGPSKFYGG